MQPHSPGVPRTALRATIHAGRHERLHLCSSSRNEGNARFLRGCREVDTRARARALAGSRKFTFHPPMAPAFAAR